MEKESIIILDFGGQYNQLIARRVREANVYCEVHPYDTALEKIKAMRPHGIILTGGPSSVLDEKSPHCDAQLFSLGIPILGICYGAQLMAYAEGGKVIRAETSEYGRTEVHIDRTGKLFHGVCERTACWMSHTDRISEVPPGFRITAFSDKCPVAAMEDDERGLFAVQFHPEVTHTEEGTKMLQAFIYGPCGCKGDWRMDDFLDRTIEEIRAKVGKGKVLCALSGGVDSSVAAVIASRAVGRQLTCVFVDHGLLRKGEADEVDKAFGPGGTYDMNFLHIDASKRFYGKLKGAVDPESKRKIIGEEFIRVFEEEAKKIGRVDYLVQGTIYPDVIESGLWGSAAIKSHHNVGGLPDCVDFKEIIEPLGMLFKDEVRKVGLELGLPEDMVYRQPFPGPGLGVRIIGEITPDKVKMTQEADAILREEISSAGMSRRISQYFAALTDMRSVGVAGDFRTYDYAVAIRAVTTSDFMTAEAVDIPWPLLRRIVNRIVNEVPNVNRVLYDITSKPPGTIEFE